MVDPFSNTRRFGFTLVELLVVLIVISVLIGFTTVRVTDAIDSARNMESKALTRNAYKSAQAFYTDNNESYGSTAALVAHLIADGIEAEVMDSALDNTITQGKVGVFVGGSQNAYFESSAVTNMHHWLQDAGNVVTVGSESVGTVAALANDAFVYWDGGAASAVSIKSDGSGHTVLSGVATGRYQVSPDRSKILYEYADGVSGNNVIASMDADGSNATDLTSSADLNTQATWSADGTQIVFMSMRDAGNMEIYKMNADGSNETRLTSTPLDEQSPVFSPDGTQIAYTEGVFGTKDLHVMNSNGSGQTNLTSGNHDATPVWASNSTIVFLRGDGNVYKINDSGAGLAALTSTGNLSEFVLSSDGARVFTLSSAAQRAGRANVAGGGEIWITNVCPNTPSSIARSPDDSQVAFVCDGNIYKSDATVGASAAPSIVAGTGGAPSELTWDGVRTSYMF